MDPKRRHKSDGILSFPLRSRLISHCCYQPTTKLLALRMRTGRWLVYADVDGERFNELVASSCPGYLYETELRAAFKPPLHPWGPRALIFLRRVRKTTSFKTE